MTRYLIRHAAGQYEPATPDDYDYLYTLAALRGRSAPEIIADDYGHGWNYRRGVGEYRRTARGRKVVAR